MRLSRHQPPVGVALSEETPGRGHRRRPQGGNRSMPKSTVAEVVLFTDGACSGNPGPGGWAYILRHPESGRETKDSGAEPDTTNNRMELTAVVRGLEQLCGVLAGAVLQAELHLGAHRALAARAD